MRIVAGVTVVLGLVIAGVLSLTPTRVHVSEVSVTCPSPVHAASGEQPAGLPSPLGDDDTITQTVDVDCHYGSLFRLGVAVGIGALALLLGLLLLVLAPRTDQDAGRGSRPAGRARPPATRTS